MTAPARWTMWIWCCEACGAGDFSASWGNPAAVPPGDWRCRRCRETAWSLACLRVPVEQATR
jgi:hypothetical protein